jgi:hypothetical protein
MADSSQGVRWIAGPRRGVCANRNNALRAVWVEGASHVAFVDDDIQLHSDFIDIARRNYAAMSHPNRGKTILTGGNAPPTRFSFRGYFQTSDKPECVDIHAAIFPISLFSFEVWDENIFFGSEDAELCLRALRRDFVIQYVPELRSDDSRPNAGILAGSSIKGSLSKYRTYCEAARLYIGVKRYRKITPNVWKLVVFLGLYFLHLVIYLLRENAIEQLASVIRTANLERLYNRADSPAKLYEVSP